MNDNKCLFCGDIIPEGRQICPICEKEPHEKIIDLKKENSKLSSLIEHLQSLVTERWFKIKRLEEKNQELDQENKSLQEKAQKLASKSILKMQERNEQERKETAREIANEIKMAFYYEFDELIPSIMSDKIDSIIEKYGVDLGEKKCKYFKTVDYGYRVSTQCYAQKCAPEVYCNGDIANCEKHPKIGETK